MEVDKSCAITAYVYKEKDPERFFGVSIRNLKDFFISQLIKVLK